MKLVSALNRYSPEARQGMAVLGVAALAVAGLFYVILSLHDAAALRLRQAEAEHRLVAARAAKAATEGATRLTAADDVAPMFLAGDTPGLAFAQFQSLVGEAATAAGLVVKRLQPVDTGDGEGTMPYRLSIDADGSIAQLRDFLVKVETGLPVMFVTGLDIQPAGAAASEGGAADPYPSEALRSTLRIEAYGWRAAP